jgi:adsorption protein B
MLSTDFHTLLLFLAQVFFVLATVIFAISAIDDLLIDGYFYLRLLWRRLKGKSYTDLPAIEELEQKPEQPLALMLPAWKEADVLYGAVANLIKTIDYRNFHVFIGVYPNDHETMAEANRLSQQFRQVHTVVTQLPGPTCKADCLNNIIEAISTYEEKRGIQFAGVIMQDAEDIIHPLSMKLFNFYLPEHDLIQIPVYSLKRKWWQLTGGHYMDEFAEYHSKEILVRQSFAGVVPGAGVGTAMSKKALQFAKQQSGEYYSTSSLTEDYEFSFRTQGSDLKQVFVRLPLTPTDNQRYDIKADEPGDRTGRFIATREFFPGRFWWAVRQKTRWTIGISFQAWESMSWKGNWKLKYLFWRDRKMIFFSHAIAMGLASIIIFAGYQAYQTFTPDSYQLAPLLHEQHWLWQVVYFNLGMMAFRILQRMAWTSVYYGVSAAPMVIPRYIWAAIINYFAIVRATRAFLLSKLTGQRIGWDKTSHDLPEMTEIDALKLPLGELLLHKGLIAREQLDEALAFQSGNPLKLGRVLLQKGWVQEDDLVQTLAEKYHLRIVPIDPLAIPAEMLTTLPYEMMRSLRVIPFQRSIYGLDIASCNILDHDELELIETTAGEHIHIHLTNTQDVSFALHVAARLRAREQEPIPALDDLLLDVKQRFANTNVITLAEHTATLRKKYVPLGEHLLRKGMVDGITLEHGLERQRQEQRSLGQQLVESGVISADQHRNALQDVTDGFIKVLEEYHLLDLPQEDSSLLLKSA